MKLLRTMSLRVDAVLAPEWSAGPPPDAVRVRARGRLPGREVPPSGTRVHVGT